jgi:peptide-methionine (S)-S-oxide reductase
MKRVLQTIAALAIVMSAACRPNSTVVDHTSMKPAPQPNSPTELATLGGGCFWCTEAIFQMLPGVKSVTSGYAGGTVANPTYEQVCSGNTGHAEVIQIAFDPTTISYEAILKTFWDAHDPTTLNRQGNDAGTQYRSIILYHDARQKELAEKSKAAAQAHFSDPIVTEIVPLQKFYAGEGYHQNYYRANPNQGYCRAVIRPKVEKFEKKLKAERP